MYIYNFNNRAFIFKALNKYNRINFKNEMLSKYDFVVTIKQNLFIMRIKLKLLSRCMFVFEMNHCIVRITVLVDSFLTDNWRFIVNIHFYLRIFQQKSLHRIIMEDNYNCYWSFEHIDQFANQISKLQWFSYIIFSYKEDILCERIFYSEISIIMI